jgi:hypothetical protein
MPLPLLTFGFIFIRATLRPINRALTTTFKRSTLKGEKGYGQRSLEGLGYYAFKFEDMSSEKDKFYVRSAS